MTTAALDDTARHDERRDALAARMGDMMIASMELLTVYLGERLGLYAALRDGGPATAHELAARAGIDERYALEWLEQQAMAGVLDVDDVAAAPGARRFGLPSGHGEVLLDERSPHLLGPASRFIVGMAQRLPDLLAAYRTGAGVDWAEYGPDVIEAQEALNRPHFEHFLPEWIAAMPDIAARLAAGGRVADVGCGTGWSSVWFAHHYPGARVDGIDIDEGSIARARQRAEHEGVADRVRFFTDARAAATDGHDRYDLVAVFEALHDMADPVSVLGMARDLLAPGGAVLIADERTDESFNTMPDSIDRMFYGFSVLGCLPNGRVGATSVATGTVIRPATLERYARDAGFAGVTILPTEHGQFRFYRLDP
jgi:2-polyprenyl-3-methyl-5-hydroxy-6-metoxy-1,4-benzoquinol methylase